MRQGREDENDLQMSFSTQTALFCLFCKDSDSNRNKITKQVTDETP